MKSMKLLPIGVTAWLLASLPAAAEVSVTIHDGLVSVIAKDATIRQILMEWARVGQAKVINGERIPGGPISLELTNVPEQQALDVLLRSVSGFIVAPRPTVAANLSRYDRVIVMPTSATPRPAPAAAPPTAVFQQPQFPQPSFPQPGVPGVPMIPDDDGDDPRAQPNVTAPAGNQRQPTFQPFTQPQVVNPGQPLPTGGAPFQLPPVQPAVPPPAPYPTAPSGGVAVPGMIVPAPQQQNVPGMIPAPGQVHNPQQPRRSGGGR